MPLQERLCGESRINPFVVLIHFLFLVAGAQSIAGFALSNWHSRQKLVGLETSYATDEPANLLRKKRDFFFAFSHSVNDEIDDYRKRFQVIGKAQ